MPNQPDVEIKSLIADLKEGHRPKFNEIRRMQQYSVQIYRSAPPRFSSIIEETLSGWLVVDSSMHYTEIGLHSADAVGVEGYIV